ncbi:MAG: bifunctional riboflavin kinase/FAD synthetase [Saprospiraceae bacterium]|nr:bifunctional riboflavin kinase/FAD synthetase [Saprospiraceae bacterium]
MKIYRDLTSLPAFTNTVITIGSFDGVHRGHQRLIRQVKRLAKGIKGESVIITFHPHPRKIVYPQDRELEILTSLEEKILLIEKFGIDHLVIIPFTVEFSQLHPREYIEKFLLGTFNPRYIVIGYDHRFGLNREGSIALLKEYEVEGEREVIEIDKQAVEEIVVSSTKIRNAINQGQIELANRLLNYHYLLSGIIVHGEKIGSTIGYPTANIQLVEKEKLIPKDGVYAVRITVDEATYDAMLYIGKRPVIKGQDKRVIEVHIFDFSEVIYGLPVQVEVIKHIRDEMSFDRIDDLKLQLMEDEVETRRYLSNYQSPYGGRQQDKGAVVILNYNGLRHLQEFLPSVVAHTASHLPIYIVDNHSTDKSIEWVQQKYPYLQVIKLNKNYGFAEGYNRGLAQVDAQYYLLLNSDVEVSPYWATRLLEQLESVDQAVAIQPKILSYRDKESFEYAGGAGGWMDATCYPFCMGRLLNEVEKDHHQYDVPVELAWASGAAMAIRSDIFHNLGGFDEDYFAHHEEIDLCWRIRRAGFKIISAPGVQVYHLGGGTLGYQSPQKVYLNFRNNLCTYFKNKPWSQLVWIFPLRVVLDLAAAAHYLTRKRFDFAYQVLHAYGSFLIRFPKWIEKRKQYNRRIAQYKPITPKAGFYRGSIIWDYYVRGLRAFSQLQSTSSSTLHEERA